MTPSLIDQLQAEALDPRVSISDLLRKAKLVAAKLGRDDAVRWVDDELNGYGGSPDIPEYRGIVGHPRYLNPYHGWQEIQFEDREIYERLTQRRMREPVSELEALLGRGDGDLGIPLPPSLVAQIEKASGVEVPHASLKIERSQIARILDSVRSRVLDWALALERAGVRGEGLMGFSRHDKEVAATVTYNVNVAGSFAGNVGPVSGQGRVTATQLTAGTLEALGSLAEEIQTHAGQMKLPAEERTRLEKQAAALKEEARRPTPDPAALQRALTSIKTIAEIAAGDLIAAGILHAVGRYLPLIVAAAGGG